MVCQAQSEVGKSQNTRSGLLQTDMDDVCLVTRKISPKSNVSYKCTDPNTHTPPTSYIDVTSYFLLHVRICDVLPVNKYMTSLLPADASCVGDLNHRPRCESTWSGFDSAVYMLFVCLQRMRQWARDQLLAQRRDDIDMVG